MLAYLEALCSALKSRDALVIAELLRHPLASALPSAVVDEAQRIASSQAVETVAPVHALRLYHQTAHLLGTCSDPATKRRTTGPARSVGVAGVLAEHPRQMELELPYRAAVA